MRKRWPAIWLRCRIPNFAVRAGIFPVERCFNVQDTSQAVLGLAQRYGVGGDRSVVHSYAPLGTVDINDGCTGCGACAAACHTEALTMEQDEDEVAILFDARRCIACGECEPVCPENVVQIDKRTDLHILSQGSRTLYQDQKVRCERCGAPVAPRAMLERFAHLLGKHQAFSTITRYCVACRQTNFDFTETEGANT